MFLHILCDDKKEICVLVQSVRIAETAENSSSSNPSPKNPDDAASDKMQPPRRRFVDTVEISNA
jgi:hypothetical protein